MVGGSFRAKTVEGIRRLAAQPIEPENVPRFEAPPTAGESLDSRHIRRIMQEMLLEVRTTRQYVGFLHQWISERVEEVPSNLDLRGQMKEKHQKKRDEFKTILQRRAAEGLPDGGMGLTEEERQRIENGEDPGDVIRGY